MDKVTKKKYLEDSQKEMKELTFMLPQNYEKDIIINLLLDIKEELVKLNTK